MAVTATMTLPNATKIILLFLSLVNVFVLEDRFVVLFVKSITKRVAIFPRVHLVRHPFLYHQDSGNPESKP